MNVRINKPYKIEFSVGVASFPYDTKKSLDDMVAAADLAMYEQKKRKKSEAEKPE